MGPQLKLSDRGICDRDHDGRDRRHADTSDDRHRGTSVVGRLFFGTHASFIIREHTLNSPLSSSIAVFIAYAMMGLVMGLLATVYARSIYRFEDIFDRLPGNYYTRHALGMTVIGIIMYLLMRNLGQYYIEGVGYATIQDILAEKLAITWILLSLILLKLLAVSITLGSGASGGVFSPALFMGATLGGGHGHSRPPVSSRAAS